MSIPLLVTQRSATPGGGAARACRSTMRRKIVVFYPPHDVPALGPRLCALAPPAPLLSHGFVVVITDAASMTTCSNEFCGGSAMRLVLVF